MLSTLLAQEERLVNAAPVDADGLPIEINRTVTYADFPNDRFEEIRNTKKLLLIATFSTTNDGSVSVRVHNDQDLKLKLGAIFNVTN